MNLKWKVAAIVITLVTVMSGVTAFVINTTQNTKEQNALIRVACVGDSITNMSGYPDSYSDNLWMLLGANYNISRFGVDGATVTLGSERPYINQIELQKAKDFQPKIVIIMLGTNDARPDLHRFNGSFVEDYERLIAEFEVLPSKPKIWIVEPPPIFHNGTGLSTEFFDKNIIPNIQQVAKETNLPIVDVYSALACHEDYFWDGVHPRIEGSKVIADEIYKALISSIT